VESEGAADDAVLNKLQTISLAAHTKTSFLIYYICSEQPSLFNSVAKTSWVMFLAKYIIEKNWCE
jgi:hypothetical protein